jgi:hypothetical protein
MTLLRVAKKMKALISALLKQALNPLNLLMLFLKLGVTSLYLGHV